MLFQKRSDLGQQFPIMVNPRMATGSVRQQGRAGNVCRDETCRRERSEEVVLQRDHQRRRLDLFKAID
jgi:hypothetical protein